MTRLPSRTEMIQTLYHYKDNYTLDNPLYKTSVVAFLNAMLGEDLSEKGCLTAWAIFQREDHGKAVIRAREKGILAGLEETCLLLDNFRQHLAYECAMIHNRPIHDGDPLAESGTPILFLHGSIITILEIERTVLNVLQRMSGIATEVFEQQEKIRTHGYASHLAATRKLQWGRMDKKAFIVGGGLSHRRGLYDAMMIKDTEIDFWNYLERNKPANASCRLRWMLTCIVRCWEQRTTSNGLIVEVQTQEEAVQAARKLKELQDGNYYPCAIMLDNFKPDEIEVAMKRCIDEGTDEWTLFESSGNIHGDRVLEYARPGVDVISMGQPTHSTNVLDIHMKVVAP